MSTSAACRLDGLGEEALREALLGCCASREWVRRMLLARPFGSDDAAMRAADAAWPALDDPDWIEAFEGAALEAAADDATGTAAAVNVALDLFRERFGYPFVIAAPGPTSEELLMRVRIRLGLEPDAQMRASRAELRRLALARLERIMETG